MFRALVRWWKYFGTKLRLHQQEVANPKVQLEQAIEEAREQDKRLRDQAANVIANQKQTEARLNRVVEEYEKANQLARQALMLSDQESRSGDKTKAGRFNDAAESSALRVLDLERQIREHETALLQATTASQSARQAVEQNRNMLEKRLQDREHLLSTLDQARMQEHLNKAMSDLSSTIGDDVPTFEEVRRKIEARLAKAQARGELSAQTAIDGRMLEVEQAQRSAEAQARLSQIRSELGIGGDRVDSQGEARPQ